MEAKSVHGSHKGPHTYPCIATYRSKIVELDRIPILLWELAHRNDKLHPTVRLGTEARGTALNGGSIVEIELGSPWVRVIRVICIKQLELNSESVPFQRHIVAHRIVVIVGQNFR